MKGYLDTSDSWSWGKDLVNNFASGMEYARSSVSTVASTVSSTISAWLKHSVPERGPLHDDDVWGLHFMQNFANGMMQGEAMLRSTVYGMASNFESDVNDAFGMGVNPNINMKPMSNRPVGIDISGNTFYVRNETDIEDIAERLHTLVTRELQGAAA